MSEPFQTGRPQPPKADKPRAPEEPFDIEFEVPVAPRRWTSPRRPADGHLVSLLAPTSFEAEQYRMLRHTVEQRGLRVLAVTSARSGDGKTTTAINLAGALAQAPETRILLLEADLRRPSVLQRLGGDGASSPGLVKAVLSPRVSLPEVIQARPLPNLAVLPAGQPPIAPYELLKSPRLGELLAEMRQHHDYVVVDTPPILACPDYRLIEKWIEGIIVVVAAHKTPRKMVEEALGLVDRRKLVGLVFNGDDSPEARYHHSTYAGNSVSKAAGPAKRQR